MTESSPQLKRLAFPVLWFLLFAAVLVWQQPGFWHSPHKNFENAEQLRAQGQPAAAMEEIDRALARRPDDPGYLVFKGYLALDLGRTPEARSAFTRALQQEAENPHASLGLASTLITLGRSDEARQLLLKIDSSSYEADLLRRRAQLWSTLGETDRALGDLLSATEKRGDDPDLLLETARVAAQAEDWTASLDIADRIRELGLPRTARIEALHTKAVALRAVGRTAAAFETFKTIASDENLAARAELAMELERHAEAAVLLGELLEMRPRDLEPRADYAFALDRSGAPTRAEAEYRQLLKEVVGVTPETRVRLAWLLNRQKRYEEAWQVLAVLPLPASNPTTHRLQAHTAAWAGQADLAVGLLDSWLDLDPRDADSWLLLAEAHRQLGDGDSRAQALHHFVELRPLDAKRHLELAGVLSATGNLEEALAEVKKLVASRPDDAEILPFLAILYEASGNLGEARHYHELALERLATPGPDLFLRLARVNRWLGAPETAVAWYERVLSTDVDAGTKRAARTEQAEALLDADRPEQALVILRAELDAAERSQETLLLAARAASLAGRPVETVSYLEMLALERALLGDEEAWLASQLRAAGRSRDALAIYEALARKERASVEQTEAIGDLRAELEDPVGAMAAYQAIGSDSRTPALTLKVARLTAETDDLDKAVVAYANYLLQVPDDLEARLELARLLAGVQRHEQAWQHYQSWIERRGGEGIELELALNRLGAASFAEAEIWARRAVASSDSPRQANLALVQALHLQGRPGEAARLLETLLRDDPGDATTLYWLATTAMARDRNLQAYRLLEQALELGSEDPAKIWVTRGQSAFNRGDYRRARNAWSQARLGGIERVVTDQALSQLAATTAPRIDIPISFGADSNDLDIQQSGLQATAWPGDAARVEAKVLDGTVSQEDTEYERRVGLLAVENLFLTPALEADLEVGVEDYEEKTLEVAGLKVTAHLSDHTRLGASVARESLWSTYNRSDPRHFNRILDLEALGPAFYSDSVRVFADLAVGDRHRARLELGERDYADENRQAWLYAHYQIPLHEAHESWTFLRPNVYVEQFDRSERAYFSPREHRSVGAALHLGRQSGPWQLEAEVNPMWLQGEADSGAGGWAVLRAERRRGRLSAGFGVFAVYDDRDEYFGYRATANLRVRLHRRPDDR